MAFGQMLDGGQSKADPGGLGREEGLEEMLSNRRGYAVATVLHSDLDKAIAFGASYAQRAPIWHGLIAVRDEVREHLNQLSLVGLHGASKVLNGYFDCRWGWSRFKDFGDYGTKIQAGNHGLALAHVRREVLTKGRRPVDLTFHPI
jgi:hypothetical protein